MNKLLLLILLLLSSSWSLAQDAWSAKYLDSTYAEYQDSVVIYQVQDEFSGKVTYKVSRPIIVVKEDHVFLIYPTFRKNSSNKLEIVSIKGQGKGKFIDCSKWNTTEMAFAFEGGKTYAVHAIHASNCTGYYEISPLWFEESKLKLNMRAFKLHNFITEETMFTGRVRPRDRDYFNRIFTMLQKQAFIKKD